MTVSVEIIVVGSEIVQGRCGEANSRYISMELSAIGMTPSRIILLPDDQSVIASEIESAMRRSEILIVTGGLGPTIDDLTRQAAIEALGGETEERNDITASIEARYRAFGKEPPEGYRDHSIVPLGARPLPNPVGAASGLEVKRGGRELYLLPGVPSEMKEIFKASVLPSLAGRGEGSALLLRIFGLNESEVEERLRSVLGPRVIEGLSITSGVSGVDCYMKAGTWDEGMRKAMEGALGSSLYSVAGESLEEICASGLMGRGSTLSTAESVTGGLIASRIVDVPGASEFFLEGFVTYSNASKIARLGVSPGTLENHGAVSKAVCVEMAEGVRERTESDIGLSTTGIAGPGGATPEKPVGLCFIGLAVRDTSYCVRKMLAGDRNTIRSRTASIALDLLRLELRGEREVLLPFEVPAGEIGRFDR